MSFAELSTPFCINELSGASVTVTESEYARQESWFSFVFLGEPYLWARLDRKPTKQADKRFKKYQYSHKTCKGIIFAETSIAQVYVDSDAVFAYRSQFPFCSLPLGFTWNVGEDFRTVPESWIPARRVQYESGHPVPDEHGHIPGKQPHRSRQD